MTGPVDPADLPYRPCVGIMLMDRAGRVFVGRRKDTPDAWQMPQGGIDPGEDLLQAARRELREEIGTDRAHVVAVSGDWLRYDLPPHLQGRLWGGKWRGQMQKWVLMRFAGTDADIRLDADGHPEFDAFQWVAPGRLVDLIVPFKRAVYEQAVASFAPFLAPAPAVRFDHVQITVPRAAETAAVDFYGGLLGLAEVAQPATQASRGGAWFAMGGMQIHLKPDDTTEAEHRRSKRHVALAVDDLDRLRTMLETAGHEILPDTRPIPGVKRLFVRDPGGNRLELIQA